MRVLGLVILLILGIIIYSNTFYSSFHFDDQPSIVQNYYIRNPANLTAIWNFWPMRFITYVSLALNYYLHRLDLFGYHLFNLIIHITSALLASYLTFLTLSTPAMKDKKIAGHAELIAFFVGLVFLTHPIQTQAVTYIIQRATSLAALFYLASLSLYAKYRLTTQKPYYWGCLLTMLLAMFTKEMAITLSLAILLYEYSFFNRQKAIPWRKFAPVLLMLLVIPITMLLSRSVDFLNLHKFSETAPDISPSHYLLTQFRVLVTYLRLLILPLNQNLDYDYPISRGIFNLPTLASLILLVVILVIALRIYQKHRLISFSIFWFFLTLLPESGIIPIKDVIFEHRLYLPMFGFSLFLVTVAYYLLAKKTTRSLITVLILLIAVYSILTYQRNLIWKDEFSLWNDAVHKSPHKARPYNNRGLAYEKQGNFTQAISDYDKAIEIDPNFADAYNNRGILYKKQGKLKQAMADYNRALEINLNFAEAYNNRGNIYEKQGNLDQAILDYNEAIRHNPSLAGFYNNRGAIYYRKGNFKEALVDFNKAAQVSPNFADAYNNRGLIYYNQGKIKQAFADFNKAIEIKPNFAVAYSNRAVAYFFKEDYAKSWEDVHKAEKLGYKVNPEFPETLKIASKRQR